MNRPGLEKLAVSELRIIEYPDVSGRSGVCRGKQSIAVAFTRT